MRTVLVYLPLAAAAVDMAVGTYILIKDARLRSNRLFFLVACALATWGVGEYLMRTADNPAAGILAGRIGAIGWCFVGTLFLHLALEIANWRKTRRAAAALAGLYAISLGLLLVTFLTPLVFKRFVPGVHTGYSEVAGVLRVPSELFVIGPFIAGIVVLLRARARTTSSETRTRQGYVIIAASIPLVIGIVTDVILPLAGRQPPFSSQVGGPIMAIIIAVGVTRKGLMTSVVGVLGSTVIANMQDAVLVTGPDGTIETVNHAAVSLTGYPEGDLIDMNISELFAQRAGEPPLDPVAGIPPDKSRGPRMVLCRQSDGRSVPVSRNDSTITKRRGKITGFITVLQDMRNTMRLLEAESEVVAVSAEVKAEQERRELLRRSSEELARLSSFLESVLEKIAEPLWIKDRAGRYVYVNEAFASLLEVDRAEVLGRTDAQCPWADESETVNRAEEAALASGEQGTIEFSTDYLGGLERVFNITITPMAEEGGGTEFLIGLLADVTEQKQLETARLDFIRIAAHELRAPLTSLKLGLEMLARLTDNALNPEQQRSLDILSMSIERLSRLSKNLLDLASMDAGLVTLRIQEVDVAGLFHEARTMFSSAAREKGLEVRLEVPEGLRPASGDPSRLSQVLYNLVSNAVKYTDRGTITMSARDLSDGMIEISVSDTGIGIPSSAKDAIFTRFVKARSAETAREGTGLGLSITKAIVEAHGGTIRVESAVGSGSTFTFTLPGAPPRPLPR